MANKIEVFFTDSEKLGIIKISVPIRKNGEDGLLECILDSDFMMTEDEWLSLLKKIFPDCVIIGR